jgi:riboflavin kinase, archaea type
MSILKRCVILEKEFQSKMLDAFESEQVVFMRGKIASGLGQGQYFLTREGYSRQFVQKLGFVPFPGTLNVLLEGPFPAEKHAIRIEGFLEEGKSFGECKCYRIKLNGMQAAVVRPEKSRYPPELIEVIAPVKLRALGLEDGDPVDVILL